MSRLTNNSAPPGDSGKTPHRIRRRRSSNSRSPHEQSNNALAVDLTPIPQPSTLTHRLGYINPALFDDIPTISFDPTETGKHHRAKVHDKNHSSKHSHLHQPVIDMEDLPDAQMPLAHRAPFQKQTSSKLERHFENVSIMKEAVEKMSSRESTFIAVDLGTSSTVVSLLLSNSQSPQVLQYDGQNDIQPTVIFLPSSAWQHGCVSLNSMSFGHKALREGRGDTRRLLSFWKPFTQAETQDEFTELLETYCDTGFHTPLVFREGVGTCYRFEAQVHGQSVKEDIPLWDIEHHIIKSYIYIAQAVHYAPMPVVHAVFAMPVYTPMSVRQRRRQALCKALEQSVQRWSVLAESACAFIGTVMSDTRVDWENLDQNMVVVDMGEGTLDISTGSHTTHHGIEFWNHTGNTQINGFSFTAAVSKRIWRALDPKATTSNGAFNVEHMNATYSNIFVQHLLACAQSIKEQLASPLEQFVHRDTKSFLCTHHGLSPTALNRVQQFIQTTPQWTYTKEEFIEDTAPITKHLMGTIDKCVSEAPKTLDTVICIGRSWKNSSLTAELRRRFPQLELHAIHMDKGVSMGAAFAALFIEYDTLHQYKLANAKGLLQAPLSTNVYVELTNHLLHLDPSLPPLELELVFRKGDPLPARKRIQTERCDERHAEIDYSVYLGDSPDNASLLCTFVVPAHQKDGYVDFHVSFGEELTVESAHGGNDPTTLHLTFSSLYNHIRFDANRNEQHFATTVLEDQALEPVSRKRKRTTTVTTKALPAVSELDVSHAAKRRCTTYRPQGVLYHLRQNISQVKTVISLSRNDLNSASSPITSLTEDVVNMGMDIFQEFAPPGFMCASSELIPQLAQGDKVPFRFEGDQLHRRSQSASRVIREKSVLLVPVLHPRLGYWFLLIADLRTHNNQNGPNTYNGIVCYTVKLSPSAANVDDELREQAHSFQTACTQLLAQFLGKRNLKTKLWECEDEVEIGDSGIFILACAYSMVLTELPYPWHSFSMNQNRMLQWRQKWRPLMGRVDNEAGFRVTRRHLREVYTSLSQHENDESDEEHAALPISNSTIDVGLENDDNQSSDTNAIETYTPNRESTSAEVLDSNTPSPTVVNNVNFTNDGHTLFKLDTRNSPLQFGVQISRMDIERMASKDMWITSDIIDLFLSMLQKKYDDTLFCLPTGVCERILRNHESAYEFVHPQWIEFEHNHSRRSAPRTIHRDQHIVAVMNDYVRKHWVLIVVPGGGNAPIRMFDSLVDAKDMYRQNAVDALKQYLNQSQRLVLNKSIPQQTDSTSCGFFAMEHALNFARHGLHAISDGITQQYIDRRRQRWTRCWESIGKEQAESIDEETLEELLFGDDDT
uniref:Ubiquitin-like protease family profile domain-containing protein n=1 Tax=Percolomonas cosmopolitus TaxID=63605 RepID=A0A7S1KL61_9EUKA|mmetsp:Transcript_10523/g.39125  ORF Transcript_10523/g.39125 Transcript_10523/m.39125 type:complete len:1347 (+) Transcript_10523:210-4250(+)|eukprot:CAMPEP_0117441886 /NCGR_PEP_ID=MMETSP0759-20121206/3865_1 /TAXON_ID=63605 /ORGANISM="Percolomonas cosmopolitus, Strain WS" /LENGTH=1346 /DNA_ID=CAMNT_0005233753 /DNA_START=195 /DNA_END=4235 /DNA_ORIENTATION=-